MWRTLVSWRRRPNLYLMDRYIRNLTKVGQILVQILLSSRKDKNCRHTCTATIENVSSCKDFIDVWGYLSKRYWKTPKFWISELFSSLLVTLDLRSDRDVTIYRRLFDDFCEARSHFLRTWGVVGSIPANSSKKIVFLVAKNDIFRNFTSNYIVIANFFCTWKKFKIGLGMGSWIKLDLNPGPLAW